MNRAAPSIAIIVPCFNEEVHLPACLAALLNWMQARPAGDAEVVLVDDGSRDRTWEIIANWVAGHPGFRGVSLVENRGSHVALRCGYRHVTAARAVNLPADMQEPVENVDELVRVMDAAGADVVMAVRRGRDDGIVDRVASRCYHAALRAIGMKNLPLSGASQFLLSRRVLLQINSRDDHVFTLDGFFAASQLHIENVFYHRTTVKDRRSRWTLGRKVRHVMDTVLGFSNVPIRILTTVGAMTAVCGLAYGAFLIVHALTSEAPPGWASLMCAVILLGGLNLLALGMLGEYAWRILDESRRRPLFVVNQRAGFPNDADD